MKHWLITPLIVMGSACMAQVAPSSTAPLRSNRALTVAVGTFECAVDGSNSRRLCDEIPVVVLINPAGGCIAQLPYHELHIGTDKTNAIVVWKLIGPPGYAFQDPDGIQLLPTGGIDPSTVWQLPRRIASDKYLWRIRLGALKGSFGHVANVVSPTGVACIAGDPVVTNDAN